MELLTDVWFLVLLVALIAQVILYLSVFSKLAFYKRKEEGESKLPPVTVIVCAKNEEDNLQKLLPAVLNQEYPDFEVIVVNDQSVDDTQLVLENFKEQYSHLKIIKIEQFINEHTGKKFALTLAMKTAKNDMLLFTDADCEPMSNQWIKLMVRNYTAGVQFVVGYSPYEKKKTLLNLFIQFDTFYTALQYFSFALKGKPYMGVGRNMSYLKPLFFKHKGFAPHYDIPYGDDDLFINDHAKGDNLKVELDPRSFVLTFPKTMLDAWINQKRRHLITGKKYKPENKRRQAYVWAIQVLFYLIFIPAIILSHSTIAILSLLLAKVIITVIIYGFALKRLKNVHLIYAAPFIDIIYQILLLPFISLTSGKIMKRNVW